MGPERRAKRRFIVALSVAVVLAAALVYTSVSASSEASSPSQLLAGAQAGRTYELTGRVLPGYTSNGDALTFRVADRAGGRAILVHYTGEVPDPFRAGREVIVTVRRDGNAFVGERDSLITKCPSKFSDAKPA
jgi:cytochrome c-type biogenesis protein CcmE